MDSFCLQNFRARCVSFFCRLDMSYTPFLRCCSLWLLGERGHISQWREAGDIIGFPNAETKLVQFSSVPQSCLTLCDPHEPQHARPPCPSPTPRVHPDSGPSSPWCHPAISSSVIPFSSCPQSLPASGSFPMSQLFS